MPSSRLSLIGRLALRGHGHGTAIPPGSKITDMGDIAAQFTQKQQEARAQIRNFVADKNMKDALLLAGKNFQDPIKVVTDIAESIRNPQLYRFKRAGQKEQLELLRGMKPAERVKFLKSLQGQQ